MLVTLYHLSPFLKTAGMTRFSPSSPVYPTYLLYNTVSLAIFVYSAVRIIIFVCARDLLERISEQTEEIEFESEEDLPEEENSEVENIIEDREEENNDET